MRHLPFAQSESRSFFLAVSSRFPPTGATLPCKPVGGKRANTPDPQELLPRPPLVSASGISFFWCSDLPGYLGLRGFCCGYFGCWRLFLFLRSGGQRDAVVFVNRLALVVVFGMPLAVRAGDGLRRFIGFKPQVARLVLFGFGFLPEAGVAEHQIVVRLQIFGVDGQRFVEFGNGICVAFFKEEHAAKFVVYDAVARELPTDG